MFKRILLPIDHSNGSNAALKVAGTLARQCRAKVFVLYVVELPTVIPPVMGMWGNTMDFLKPARETGERWIASAAKRLRTFGAKDVQTELRVGHPAKSILEFVKQKKIEHVVMGTHGRGGVGRIFLGSVAEKVLRQCTVPVTTVRVK